MRRRAVLIAVLVAATVLGAAAGLRVAGPSTHQTQLGGVQLDVDLSGADRRGLNVYVPLADWGLRAKVTGAPVRITAEPRGIDRAGVARTVTGSAEPVIRRLRSELDDALNDAAVRAAVFLLLGGVLGGLVAALGWHALGVRGRALWLAPAGGALLTAVLVGGLVVWTAATWNPGRLEQPRYYASGAELERIVAQADRLRRTGEEYADQVDTSIRAIAGLLAERPADAGADTWRILLASDIHNNVLPLPTLRRYGDGSPAVLAGDFTVNGSRVETGLLRGLATLGTPTLAVSGNHDSDGLMRDLARRGITVLTHTGALQGDGSVRPPAVRDVGGMTFAGFEDPLQYKGGGYPLRLRTALSFGDYEDSSERFRRAVAEQWQWWLGLPERPDVLIVHEQGIGRALANLIWDADPDGAPLTIMAGHTHEQSFDRYGPVTLVNGGTAGAGGIFGAGSQAVGLALLDFAAGGALEATDLVQTDPTTTASRAQRVIADDPACDDELVFCHDEPELLDLPDAD